MCEVCGWKLILDQIDDMLGDVENTYTFAEKTLDGIASWITENEHVTPAQQEAVNNIQDSRGII